MTRSLLFWSGRGGSFKQPTIRWSERTTPPALAKEASQHLISGAATPPSPRRGLRSPRPFGNRPTNSFQPGAVLDIFREPYQHRFILWPYRRRDNHSVRFETAKFPRLKIRHDDNLAANQRLGRVSQRDAGENL